MEVKKMTDELIEIALSLRNWCKKYNKKYIDMAVVNGSVMANVSQEDKDYKKLDIYIGKEEN